MSPSEFDRRAAIVVTAVLRTLLVIIFAFLLLWNLLPSLLYSNYYSYDAQAEVWFSSTVSAAVFGVFLEIPAWFAAPAIARRCVSSKQHGAQSVVNGPAASPGDETRTGRSRALFVERFRIIMVATVRALGLVLGGTVFFWTTASWLYEGWYDGDLLDFYYYGPRLIVGGIAILIGLISVFFTRRLVNLFIVFPSDEACPKCGFSLEGFRADRCPECGLYLGEDFHAPPPPTATEAQTRATDPAQAGQCSPPTQEH